jgi:hypothetical protein
MKGLNSFLAISENTAAMGGQAPRGQLPDVKANQVDNGKEHDVLDDLNQLNNLLYATKDYSKQGAWSKPVADLPPSAHFNEVEAKTKDDEPQRFNALSQSKSLSSIASADDEPQAKPQKQE